MALLTVQNVSLWFGEREIMGGVNFSVDEKAHVALIGVNGSGKTSLFKMITGELQPDEGEIITSRNTTIGYMEQMTLRGNLSVYDEALTVFAPLMEMEERLELLHDEVERSGGDPRLIEQQQRLSESYNDGGGLTYRARTRSALLGLGFDERQLSQPVDTLSGGQRSKVQLCKLLLSEANLMLLDEPTNHLDIASTRWLEEYLLSSRSAYIVISHDRYFLDRVTSTTLELENRRVSIYSGSYSRYLEAKMENREIAQRHYENTQREMKRIQGIIDQQKRWNQAHNYVTAASKQKQLDRLAATLVKVDNLPKEISFRFSVRESSANEVLTADRLALNYGDKEIFSELSLRIMKRERVFLIGSNGCGKSSLLKVLASVLPGKCGSFTLGPGIDIGYFDQTLSGLHPEKTVINEIWDRYPRMTETEVRSSLALFLFRGDDVFKQVSLLSGGEKARLAMLNLMLSKANLLLLDEPTNHLDIASREAIEQALLEYEGTLLIVSHDRYFINRLADRLYYMDNGTLTEYIGNYDDYEERRPATDTIVQPQKQKSAGANEYKLRKERESAARKRKTKIERTEAELERISVEMEQVNTELALPETASSYERVLELTEKLNALTERETELYILLEELCDEQD